MLHLIPKHTPDFGQTLAALHATPDQAALALGVAPRTVYRWAAAGAAPRPAALALWWLTPPAWSLLDCEVEHRMRNAVGLVAALRAELDAERASYARMLRLVARPGAAANTPRVSTWPAA